MKNIKIHSKTGETILKKIKKIFRRRHPITIVAYIGRKNVEKIYGAKIKKKRELLDSSSGER